MIKQKIKKTFTLRISELLIYLETWKIQQNNQFRFSESKAVLEFVGVQEVHHEHTHDRVEVFDRLHLQMIIIVIDRVPNGRERHGDQVQDRHI